MKYYYWPEYDQIFELNDGILYGIINNVNVGFLFSRYKQNVFKL